MFIWDFKSSIALWQKKKKVILKNTRHLYRPSLYTSILKVATVVDTFLVGSYRADYFLQPIRGFLGVVFFSLKNSTSLFSKRKKILYLVLKACNYGLFIKDVVSVKCPIIKNLRSVTNSKRQKC